MKEGGGGVGQERKTEDEGGRGELKCERSRRRSRKATSAEAPGLRIDTDKTARRPPCSPLVLKHIATIACDQQTTDHLQ